MHKIAAPDAASAGAVGDELVDTVLAASRALVAVARGRWRPPGTR